MASSSGYKQERYSSSRLAAVKARPVPSSPSSLLHGGGNMKRSSTNHASVVALFEADQCDQYSHHGHVDHSSSGSDIHESIDVRAARYISCVQERFRSA